MDTIFTHIIKGNIPTNLIENTDYSILINDIKPQDKYHWLLIPKTPYTDYKDFINNASESEKSDILSLLNKYINQLKNSSIITNMGNKQEIKHFHIHIIGN